MGLWMTECNTSSLGYDDLDLWPKFQNMHRLQCISPVLLEEGIPILAYGWSMYGGLLHTIIGHCDIYYFI